MLVFVRQHLPGDDVFITAYADITPEQLLKLKGTFADPQPEGASLEFPGMEVNIPLVLTPAGERYTDPAWLIRKFRKLERMGWRVDEKEFRIKHFPRTTPYKPNAAQRRIERLKVKSIQQPQEL